MMINGHRFESIDRTLFSLTPRCNNDTLKLPSVFP
jgi:hypothetical protein